MRGCSSRANTATMNCKRLSNMCGIVYKQSWWHPADYYTNTFF